tara:strand:- start:490 stop:993 length:504 start_codon:yes stop_codon:yes gene_type:complete
MMESSKKIEEVQEKLKEAVYSAYLFKKNKYPDTIFEDIVTMQVLLNTVDRKWMDHLHNMDILREGIGLRAWGQRDPLLEYKREGFEMFNDLMNGIGEESLSVIYKAELVQTEPANTPPKKQVITEKKMAYNKDKERETVTVSKTNKVGRNDNCPCGSGKKYKKCCMT